MTHSKRSFKKGIAAVASVMAIALMTVSCGQSGVNSPQTTPPATVSPSGTAPVEGGFSSDPNLNEPGVFPIAKETVTLKIGLAQSANVSDYKTNKYTKMLEEKGNFNLEFELYPSNEATQKIELMIAAGGTDLPEILIRGLEDRAVATYGSGGYFLPINDYIEHSSYYLKAQLERTADKNLAAYFTSPDGNIYTVPSYAESIVNEFDRRLWLYQPWLDELGVSAPTTTDEYRALLEKIKATDLNKNGKADEIPLMGATTGFFSYYFDFLMTSFIYSDESRDWMVLEDGKINFAYTTEEWKEGLKYLRDLCLDDLLLPVSFTQDDAQAKQIMNNPDATLVGTAIIGSPSMLAGDDNRRTEYVSASPLAGPSGIKQSIFRPTLPNPTAYITMNAKNPEAAFRLLDLMMSDEATVWNRWGEPEVDWRGPTANEKGAYENMGYPAMIVPILAWGSVQNAHWQNGAPCFRTYEVAGGLTVDTDNPLSSAITLEVAEADAIEFELKPDEIIYKIMYTGEEMDTISEIKANLKTYVKEKNAAYITGYTDIDADWSNFLNELEKIGLGQFLEISQTAYDRTVGK